jgi:phospholipid/cholesterol/gamma-HCH transport system permease protein
MAAEAVFNLNEGEGAPVLALSGDWTVDTIAARESDLTALASRLRAPVVDVANLGRLDLAGACLIDRTFRQSSAGEAKIDVRGDHVNAAGLLATARKSATAPAPTPERLHGAVGLLDRIGHAVAGIGEEIIASAGFLGETLAVIGELIVNPRRIRWVSVVHTMEVAGLAALPIVALLAFFIGLVIAYLGARILGDFGASVFTVELVAFSMMREFGVVITAVLLAGRTNSAFTAEIGAMKMRQEIDAMRVMGIKPMEALVAPRVVAMLVMTPLLTFTAVMAGLLGGMLVCWVDLGISPVMFVSRIAEGIPARHFWVGIVKAPVFALTLTVIACRQGLAVGGDVASLGRRVTSSVVQAIFMVILLDALFALWFLEMGL